MICTLRESNPRHVLGRQVCYHYTKGANKSREPDSNQRPLELQSTALPSELSQGIKCMSTFDIYT